MIIFNWAQVVVGKDLYEIETEAGSFDASAVTAKKPAVAESAPAVAAVKKEDAPKPVTSKNTQEQQHHTAHRVPSIKFIGKRDHTTKHAHDSSPTAVKQVTPAAVVAPKKVPVSAEHKITKPQTGVDFWTLNKGAFYGRPIFNDKEIEAILSGGATVMSAAVKN